MVADVDRSPSVSACAGPLEECAARFGDLFFSLAQRRGFREYLTGLPAPRERDRAITCLEGAEPVAGAGMPGSAVLLVRVALGGRAGQRPAA